MYTNFIDVGCQLAVNHVHLCLWTHSLQSKGWIHLKRCYIKLKILLRINPIIMLQVKFAVIFHDFILLIGMGLKEVNGYSVSEN